MVSTVASVALSDAVDELLDLDVSVLAGLEVTGVLTEVETQQRRLDAVDARLLAQVRERGLAGELGRTGPTDLLIQALHVAPAEARARIVRSEDLTARSTLTGEPLPPLLPATSAALQAGQVTAGHVQVIHTVLAKIPHWHGPEVVEIAETFLVDQARHLHPGHLRLTGRDLLAYLDPDGTPPADDPTDSRWGLRLRRHDDGSADTSGRLSPEAVALLDTLMDTLAKPHTPDSTSPGDPADEGTGGTVGSGENDSAGSGDAETGSGNDGDSSATPESCATRAPGNDPPTDPRAEAAHDGGLRDLRSQAERWHDGLVEMMRRLLRAGLPTTGGIPATLIVHATHADLTHPRNSSARAGSDTRSGGDRGSTAGSNDSSAGTADTGTVVTGHGQRLSTRTALRIVGDGGAVLGVRIHYDGAVLSCGREQRLATHHQRLALLARDRGCSFPGCDRPAAWTEVHHVIPWAAGGPTDLDNMTLVCSYHHRHFDTQDGPSASPTAPPNGSHHPGSTPNGPGNGTAPTTHPTYPSDHHARHDHLSAGSCRRICSASTTSRCVRRELRSCSPASSDEQPCVRLRRWTRSPRCVRSSAR